MRGLILFLAVLAPVSAYTRVQRVSFNSATGSAFAVTVAATGSGNRIVVEETWFKSGACVAAMSAPTDNKGGGSSSYSADLAPVNPDTNGSFCVAFYSVASSASGITTITINSTGTFNAGFIEEWSGTGTLDKVKSGSTSTTTWSTSATATLGGSADLALGIAICGDWFRTNTPIAPFGSGASIANGTAVVAFVENATLSANTAIAATGTLDSADGINAGIVTYQAASAAVVVPRRRNQVWH